jgi:hypothetical protein
MAFSGIAGPASVQPPSQQVLQPSGHHKHRGEGAAPISDVDVQSSSISPAGVSSARPGSHVNIMA